MTNTNDLLRRALAAYDHKEEPYFERLHHVFEEIRDYLDAPRPFVRLTREDLFY